MNQCYHNGDFWQCVTATTAGQSPTTTPTSWRKLKIPSKWRWVLARLTYVNLLIADGQTDKANIEHNKALGREQVGLRDLIAQEEHEERNQHCHRGRPARVNTGRTRPIAASVILDDAYGLMNWDAENLDAREERDAYRALSQALQEVWEAWWWQELMICQRLALATTAYVGGAYSLGDHVYDPIDNQYFTFLAPGSAGPGDIAALAMVETYIPNANPLADWDEAAAYTAGDTFNYGENDYLCHQDAPAGTLPTDTLYFYPLTGWTPILPFTRTAYDVQGQGALTGPFGPIRGVSVHDPRGASNAEFFELDVTADGTRVLNLTEGAPWVWARRVTPIINNTCTNFDATQTYEATDPEDLVYDS